MSNHKGQKADEDYVYCLCIDMIGSTQACLNMTTLQFDRFNRALVEQIKPHLEKLDLIDSLLKFTGDGWILMDIDKKITRLCCLAIVMVNRFQDDMAEKMQISKDRIPPLKLAICSGRDVQVQLPDGRTDYVGDSARYAVRTSMLCFPNEILIDENIRNWIQRDFNIKTVEIKERIEKFEVKKMEDEFPPVLYCLEELKKEVASDPDAPEYYVYTFDVTGKHKEAHDLVEKKVKRLSGKVKAKVSLTAKVQVVHEMQNSWNRLLNSISDYSFAVQILKKMKTEGRINPDVKTYSIIIKKSPDYKTAKGWLETMRSEGIPPNVVTYSTLISLSTDYDTAKSWLETMRAEGILPNVVTYSTLISLSTDYDTAKSWLETMRAEGIPPDVVTYNTLISLSTDYETAKSWLETMRSEGIPPDVVTYNTLISLSTDYDTAKSWLETMRAEGIPPNVITYSSLFSKDLSNKSADEILKWYLDEKYHPEVPIEALIAGFRRIGRIDEALRLALDYPHLPAALKLVHAYPDGALQYFQNIFEDDPNHHNAAYALGFALFHLAKLEEAKLYLEKALKLATESSRKEKIKKLLEQIQNKTSDS